VVVVVLPLTTAHQVAAEVVADIIIVVVRVRQAKALLVETMQQAVAQAVVALGRRVYQWEVEALQIL
jgi:hypothetical protein